MGDNVFNVVDSMHMEACEKRSDGRRKDAKVAKDGRSRVKFPGEVRVPNLTEGIILLDVNAACVRGVYPFWG